MCMRHFIYCSAKRLNYNFREDTYQSLILCIWYENMLFQFKMFYNLHRPFFQCRVVRKSLRESQCCENEVPANCCAER
jgi:hypothetical protein